VQAMNTEGIEQEIRLLENRRYQGMLEGDANTLEQLLDDALVYTHSSGSTDTKATYLQGVKAKKLIYRTIERQDEQIQVSGTTAVVTGRASLDVIINGVPRLVNLRYIAVWVKGPNGWQTVAFQATPLSPER
jgi:ketosteroid isomerase-like protein